MQTVPFNPILNEELQKFAAIHGLSDRELELVYLLFEGEGTTETIASRLEVSSFTVSNHLKRIYLRTNTSSKPGLMAKINKQIMESYAQERLVSRRTKILLIDDEIDFVEILRNFLQTCGFDVACATSSTVALTMLHSSFYDLIVSDICMPGYDGVEMLRIYRSHVGLAMPKVVLISGGSDYSEAELLAEGAVAFLRKPIEMADLFCTVVAHATDSFATQYRADRLPKIGVAAIEGHQQVLLNDVCADGAFLSVEDSKDLKTPKLSQGSRIKLTLDCPELPNPLVVDAEVDWLRLRSRVNMPAGIGVKFVNLAQRDRSAIESFVVRERVRSLHH